MIHFGTGGWRAIIADGFTKANLQILSTALARLMADDGSAVKGICIGYDRRFLSKESAQWAAEIFSAQNIPCFVVDREAPTPLIMFAVKQLKLPYGIVVTASHNPAIYNGVKVITAGGCDAKASVTQKIETYINDVESNQISVLDYAEGLERGIITEINPLNEYIDSILSLVDTGAIKKRRLKIALDPMYGVSQTSLRTIFLTTRCEVEVIHERHDTLFGGRLPAPNAQTLGSLSNFVVENRCDLGIATDGDADRLGVIDDKGRFVHPNRLLVLLYYYLLKYRGWRGSAVRNNSTTHLLDKVAEFFGEKCYEVPVGFKYVSEKMEETDAIIGGESSGGLTVKGHICGKDGIYAATLLAEMMAVTKKSLSELYAEITGQFGEVFTSDADFTLTTKNKEKLAETLLVEKKLPEFPFEIDHVSYQDGCKVYFKNGGWVIARFSGTEPLLRFCAEADNQLSADRLISTFKTFLEV
ncbi:MAG: phosphoglucomutase/phosphomannomutase family protein [Flexilinea sp.]